MITVLLALVTACSPNVRQKSKLITVAERICDMNEEELSLYESQLRKLCKSCTYSYFLHVVQDANYNNYEMYTMYFIMSSAEYDNIYLHNNRAIAVAYSNRDHKNVINKNYDVFCCGIAMLDEVSWKVLYDRVNDRYITVELLGDIPPNYIRQFKYLEWSDEITVAKFETNSIRNNDNERM